MINLSYFISESVSISPNQTGAMSKFLAKNSSGGSHITARRRAEVRGSLAPEGEMTQIINCLDVI